MTQPAEKAFWWKILMCYSNTMKTIQSLKMNKNIFSVVTDFSEANDMEYWFSLSPLERLEAIELMRQIIYGYDPSSDRLQRVFTVVKHPWIRRPVVGTRILTIWNIFPKISPPSKIIGGIKYYAIIKEIKFDGLVKSLKSLQSVIPAKAGIQLFQYLLDAGSSPAWRLWDFLRIHQVYPFFKYCVKRYCADSWSLQLGP